MLKIESKDGYIAMGEHLIKNAKNEVDVRNALLNFQNENNLSVILSNQKV